MSYSEIGEAASNIFTREFERLSANQELESCRLAIGRAGLGRDRHHEGFGASAHRSSISISPSKLNQARSAAHLISLFLSIAKSPSSLPKDIHTSTNTSMNQPQGDNALRWKIHGTLRQAIFEDSEHDPATHFLYNVVYGLTSTKLAASDISSLIRKSEDPDTIISSLTTQIVFLASEYAFLQPHLIQLISSILSNTDFPEESTAQFSSQLVTTMSDAVSSNHAHLFETHNRTRNLIDDHVNLHCFLARLLSHGGDLVGLDDTLYVLSVGLEDHLESHQDPDIDIRAAAQYAIHAAGPIFDACVKGQVLLLPHPVLSREIPLVMKVLFG